MHERTLRIVYFGICFSCGENVSDVQQAELKEEMSLENPKHQQEHRSATKISFKQTHYVNICLNELICMPFASQGGLYYAC